MNKILSKVGIITQARMTSSRLPGKILMTAAGKSLLKWHIDRLKSSNIPIFMATTINESDNSIISFCEKENIDFYRGSENNVLSRFYECAKKFELDVIIRVTSDCPLIDGELVSQGLSNYLLLEDNKLYLSNCINRTFPRGLDFEIFSFELLQDAYEKASSISELEHVTPYINQNRSGQVNFKSIKYIEDRSNIRITVDTLEDFNLIKTLIEVYNAGLKGHKDIISMFDEFPELRNINSHIEQKNT